MGPRVVLLILKEQNEASWRSWANWPQIGQDWKRRRFCDATMGPRRDLHACIVCNRDILSPLL